MKPEVNYDITATCNVRLGVAAYVKPLNHPSGLVSNTKHVYTSKVVSIEGNSFETMNTRYVGVMPTGEDDG